MKAKYNPETTNNISGKLIESIGIICNLELAFEVKGVKYYTTSDISFPTTDVICETDLEEENGNN